MHLIESIVGIVNTVLWDYALLFLLVATGIFFTVRLGFVQIRRFGEGLRRLFGGFSMSGKKAGKEGMSSFQALTNIQNIAPGPPEAKAVAQPVMLPVPTWAAMAVVSAWKELMPCDTVLQFL